MKPSKALARACRAIVENDWSRFYKLILVLTAGVLLTVLASMFGTNPDAARVMLRGFSVASPFIYAQLCFYAERQRGSLEFLLALPMTPTQLVLAKFACLFSMTLSTVSLPIALLADLRLVLYACAGPTFIATVFMAPAVLSNKRWAPQLPLWIVLILAFRFPNRDGWDWVANHGVILSIVALLSVPAIVFICCRSFSRELL